MIGKPGQLEVYRRLLIAQDSGAAIKGPARGDVFFGGGANAADWAGRMVGSGQAIVLVPEQGLTLGARHSSGASSGGEPNTTSP